MEGEKRREGVSEGSAPSLSVRKEREGESEDVQGQGAYSTIEFSTTPLSSSPKHSYIFFPLKNPVDPAAIPSSLDPESSSQTTVRGGPWGMESARREVTRGGEVV